MKGLESSIHVNRNPSARRQGLTPPPLSTARGEVYIMYSLSLSLSLRFCGSLRLYTPYVTFFFFFFWSPRETPRGKSFCIIVVRRHLVLYSCAWWRRGYARPMKNDEARAHAAAYI